VTPGFRSTCGARALDRRISISRDTDVSRVQAVDRIATLRRAPSLTFISYGVPEKGDAKWLDHQGSFMAAIASWADRFFKRAYRP
jgi:hypothetical protein